MLKEVLREVSQMKELTSAQIYLKNRFCSSKKLDGICICFCLDAFVKPARKVIYELQKKMEEDIIKSFYFLQHLHLVSY